jgi:hypothetical protein
MAEEWGERGLRMRILSGKSSEHEEALVFIRCCLVYGQSGQFESIEISGLCGCPV